MYEECSLPPSVRYSFCIRYSRSGKLWNFWDKLSYSLKSPPTNTTAIPGQLSSADESALKEKTILDAKLGINKPILFYTFEEIQLLA
jgi:hypothetical protein